VEAMAGHHIQYVAKRNNMESDLESGNLVPVCLEVLGQLVSDLGTSGSLESGNQL
jgi:hypothetical protein